MRRDVRIIRRIKKFNERLRIKHLRTQPHTPQTRRHRIEPLFKYMLSLQKHILSKAKK